MKKNLYLRQIGALFLLALVAKTSISLAKDDDKLFDPNRIDDLEYVIITSNSLINSAESFIEWKTRKGVNVGTATVEWIISHYSGRDNAEKIRNYLKNLYTTNPFTYLLLLGDVELVPSRLIHCEAENVEGGMYLEGDFVTDFYFSDLDGTWDADNDGNFAEIEDQLDLFPDVFVGRIPVKNPTEAEIVLNKIIDYEQNPNLDYLTRVLFIADYTGIYGIYSSVAKDPIDRADFPPQMKPIMKLYDDYQNYPDAFPNTVAAQRNAFNYGYHIANHFGHGDEDSFCYLNIYDVRNFSNGNKQTIFATCACYSGDFAYSSDCAGEAFLKNPNGGGIAFIGNTDFGIGYPSGMLFDEKIFYCLFKREFYSIGKALGIAKTYFLNTSRIELHPDRWTQFVLHLLGDPEMQVWTDRPEVLNVNHPSIFYNGSNLFQVEVMSGKQRIPGATVALYKKDELLLIKETDANGLALFSFNTSTNKDLLVTAVKHNYLPYLGKAVFSTLTPTNTPNWTATPTPSPTRTPTFTPTISTPTPTATFTYPPQTPTPGSGDIPEWQIGDWWAFAEDLQITLNIDASISIPAKAKANVVYRFDTYGVRKQEATDNFYNVNLIDFKGKIDLNAHNFEIYGLYVYDFLIINGDYSGELWLNKDDMALVRRSRSINGNLFADIGYGLTDFGPFTFDIIEEYDPILNKFYFPMQIGKQWNEILTVYTSGRYSAIGIEDNFAFTNNWNINHTVTSTDWIYGSTCYLAESSVVSGLGKPGINRLWYSPDFKNAIKEYSANLRYGTIWKENSFINQFLCSGDSSIPTPTPIITPIITETPTPSPTIYVPPPVMNAEPAYTKGKKNTVSWEGIGEDFMAQASLNDDFSSEIISSPFVQSYHYTFDNLMVDNKWYFRVKARVSTEDGYVESDWSNIVWSYQMSMQTAAIWVGGYMDSRLTSKTDRNHLRLLFYSNDPEIESMEIYYLGLPTDVFLSSKGNGIFDFYADLGYLPEPAQLLLEVRGEDIYHYPGNLWPYLNCWE